MAKYYANIQPEFDTFGVWIAKTNNLLNDISTIVITVDGTTDGAVTTGNAFVNGSLGATTLVVNTAIRGGNGSVSGILAVASNTLFQYNVNVAGVLSANIATINSANVGNLQVGFLTANIANVATLIANTATINTLNVSTLNVTGSSAAFNVPVSFNANVSMNNNYLTNVSFKGYNEFLNNVSSASGTVTLDLAASNFFVLNLVGNVTLAFNNAPSGKAETFTIIAIQDGTGGRTISLPSGTKYAGGVVPPQTTAANAIDVWTVLTFNGLNIASLSVKNAS